MARTIFLTLLLALLPIYTVANEACIESPSTACMLQLIGEDIHAISDEDEGEIWRRRYWELQRMDIMREFDSSGLDAVMPRIVRMYPSTERADLITSISRKLAHDGDKRVLQLVWESSEDSDSLEAMLEAVKSALIAGYRELAEQLFDDARFLFARIIAESANSKLFNKIKRVSLMFRDEQLLEALRYEYRSAVVARSNNDRELREAGAYRQGLEFALQGEAGPERFRAVSSISRDWMKEWGAESLENEMLQEHPALFKAASMYVMGNHVLRNDKDPERALVYFDRAVVYAEGISSAAERDELYKEIVEGYEEMARKHDIDIIERATTLGEKVEDYEVSLNFQVVAIMTPMERKDFAQALAIVERENKPLLWVIYYYLLAELAKDSGDNAAVINHLQEARRYIEQLEPAQLRAEAMRELGELLRKVDDYEGARALFMQSVEASTALQGDERFNTLKKAARELEKLGALDDAREVLQMADQVIRSIEEPADRVKKLSDLSELQAEVGQQEISQEYYMELEASLHGEALVDYYLMRAQQSEREGQLQLVFNFFSQALQLTSDEDKLEKVLKQGMKMFKSHDQQQLLLSLLQHPSIPSAVQEEAVLAVFNDRVREIHDEEFLYSLIDLLDEELQLKTLVRLLHFAHEQGHPLADELPSHIQRMLEERQRLRSSYLEAMLDMRNLSLIEHYRDELLRHIDALDSVGEQLFFQAMLHYRAAEEEDQAFVSALLPTALALENRGQRARIIVVCIMAIEKY